jgi:hypothetical protein
MGASEGVFQTERAYAKDAETLLLVGGGRYHPFTLRTVLWERANATLVNLYLEVMDGDRVYLIDSLLATAVKSYRWPNAASPSPIALVPATRYRFRVTGAAGGEVQSVLAVWAELGV